MSQFVVIGLGNFGYYLATHLYEKGHEILAIDKNQSLVQEIKEKVTRAVIADATDRKALESLGVKDMDAAVVCIGSAQDASILTTLNLLEIGVKRVLAKVISEPHGRILKKIGAEEILFPDRDLAITLAERLHNPNLLEYLPFVEGYGIMELTPPMGFVGKTLRELNLINRYGLQVVAIKDIVPERLTMIPNAEFVIKDSDILILLGPHQSLDKLKEEER